MSTRIAPIWATRLLTNIATAKRCCPGARVGVVTPHPNPAPKTNSTFGSHEEATHTGRTRKMTCAALMIVAGGPPVTRYVPKTLGIAKIWHLD